MSPRLLVLGLGNTILTDDGVGIHVARRVKELISDDRVAVVEASLAGFNLLDLVVGYDAVIIVDAIECGDVPVGEVCELDTDSFRASARLASVHDVDLATALKLGDVLKLHMPKAVEIYGISVADPRTFGEGCTPEVERAIPGVARVIAERVRSFLASADAMTESMEFAVDDP